MSDYNAKCDICGKPYKICRSCQNIKSFQSWRTVTDTFDHYAIYLALVEYARTKNKENAKKELLKCDLSNKDSFKDNIKVVIDEIFKEDKKDKQVQKQSTAVVINNNKFVKTSKLEENR